MLNLNLDATTDGQDWIKRGAWDLSIDSGPRLNTWLMNGGHGPDWFKATEAFKANVSRMPWLAEWDAQTSPKPKRGARTVKASPRRKKG